MLVYKYRGGDDEIFQRDLSSLEKELFLEFQFREFERPPRKYD